MVSVNCDMSFIQVAPGSPDAVKPIESRYADKKPGVKQRHMYERFNTRHNNVDTKTGRNMCESWKHSFDGGDLNPAGNIARYTKAFAYAFEFKPDRDNNIYMQYYK